MNEPGTKVVTCAVCGAQTNHHTNWFLVAENRWLDHLKILSWHPTLADQAEIQSVCGEEHLKILILHWLTQANLNLRNGNHTAVRLPAEPREQTEAAPATVGRLLGELAVHRNPLSQNWTGSTQTLECIVNALTGNEAKASAADYSLASFHAEPPAELAFAQSAGCA
jgi:hypothetical protein